MDFMDFLLALASVTTLCFGNRASSPETSMTFDLCSEELRKGEIKLTEQEKLLKTWKFFFGDCNVTGILTFSLELLGDSFWKKDAHSQRVATNEDLLKITGISQPLWVWTLWSKNDKNREVEINTHQSIMVTLDAQKAENPQFRLGYNFTKTASDKRPKFPIDRSGISGGRYSSDIGNSKNSGRNLVTQTTGRTYTTCHCDLNANTKWTMLEALAIGFGLLLCVTLISLLLAKRRLRQVMHQLRTERSDKQKGEVPHTYETIEHQNVLSDQRETRINVLYTEHENHPN